MNVFKKSFVHLLLASGALVWSTSASATWLGLADGDYDVALTGCDSAVVSCPVTGALTISGSGATLFDFIVDGQLFAGDPSDGLQGSNERSDLAISPFAFFSLIYTPDPATPEYWVYCKNTSENSCRPTVGFWNATLKTTSVPEPGMLVLLAIGIAGLGIARRRRLA